MKKYSVQLKYHKQTDNCPYNERVGATFLKFFERGADILIQTVTTFCTSSLMVYAYLLQGILIN